MDGFTTTYQIHIHQIYHIFSISGMIYIYIYTTSIFFLYITNQFSNLCEIGFSPWWSNHSLTRLKQQFNELDENGDGIITFAELKTGMSGIPNVHTTQKKTKYTAGVGGWKEWKVRGWRGEYRRVVISCFGGGLCSCWLRSDGFSSRSGQNLRSQFPPVGPLENCGLVRESVPKSP